MIFIRKVLLIILINYIDNIIQEYTLKLYTIIPLTFLLFSFYVYKSKRIIGPLESFIIGIFVDIISESFLGLNAALFCITTYLVNLNSNSFKLFSYFQISLFFGIIAAAYVGFYQLVVNLYNFSYLILFISLITNIMLCITFAFFSIYFPNFKNRI